MHKHPSHSSQINRLKRVEGQLRGVIRFIDEGKYCIDILNQLKAVQKALASVESNILGRPHRTLRCAGYFKSR